MIPTENHVSIPPSFEQEIARYLCSGKYDSGFQTWPGANCFTNAKQADAALRSALISTVQQRCPHAIVPEKLIDMDIVAFTRAKVSPMVKGLFPMDEQTTVLDVLERSVIFLTPTNINTVLLTARLYTAWDLANLYLASYGAELLSPDIDGLLGLSEDTNCYVSINYFCMDNSIFDDFLVHEAAHIFHNCKRHTIGLHETRNREWLLEIDYRKRETFAYACEAYSRILVLGNNPSARKTLLSTLEEGSMPSDDRVDASEYIDILREAVSARNGWKRILGRCATSKK